MHSPSSSLIAGLKEDSFKSNNLNGQSSSYQLGVLSFLAAELIEGDKSGKKFARDLLKKMIGRGRCILNAADFAAKAKTINLDVSRETSSTTTGV